MERLANPDLQYGRIVDVRFPSLKFGNTRRFCYLQFASSSAAHQATELDDTDAGNGYKLVAKISDPSQKKSRSGAMQEGREIYVKNVDWKLNEKDIRAAFSKYGTIDNVSLPRNTNGNSKGFCHLTFSTKVCIPISLVDGTLC